MNLDAALYLAALFTNCSEHVNSQLKTISCHIRVVEARSYSTLPHTCPSIVTRCIIRPERRIDQFSAVHSHFLHCFDGKSFHGAVSFIIQPTSLPYATQIANKYAFNDNHIAPWSKTAEDASLCSLKSALPSLNWAGDDTHNLLESG